MAGRPSIVELADEHVPGAAELLAARHRAQRVVEPGLDPVYEDPAATRGEIEALRARAGASGTAAIAGDRVTGFLLGAPSDESWGPNVWVPAAGHAAPEPELVRDLYAAAAERWVAEGGTSHYVLVPATDPALVDAWFRLGFGHQHVHAIREVPGAAGDGEATSPVTIRLPRRDDIDALARLDLALPQHQVLSPVFTRLPVPSLGNAIAGWEKDFDDPRFPTFVAESDGEVVGSAVGCAVELSSTHTSLALPREAALLAFISVFPERRGVGAGRALGERVLAWARDGGYATVVTDWRMTNLTSSRALPRLGFRPTFFRLFRAIP
jgi:GNAT superfamily N-acetyltransferase